MVKNNRKGKNSLPGLRFLGIFIQFGGNLGLLPYGWDWSSNKMYYKPGLRHKVIHGLWFLVLSTYGGFLIGNSVLLMRDDEVTAFVKIRIFYMASVHVLLILGFLLNMQTFGQHHSLVNQLLSFTTEVHREFGLKINGKVLKLVLGIIVFVYLFGCTNAVAVFFSPNSKRLLTSLWESPQHLPFYAKLLLVMTHLALNVGNFYHIVHNGQILMTYIFLLNPALSKLRIQQRPSTASGFVRSQLKPVEIHRLFQQILVLQAKYTSAYGGWLLLIIIWVLFISVMNIFQAAVFHNFRSCVMASGVMFLAKSVYKACGEIYEISAAVIASWSGIKNPAWFRRYQRATRPARIPIGSAFYYDKGLMPTFMNIAVTTAANMIISYNG